MPEAFAASIRRCLLRLELRKKECSGSLPRSELETRLAGAVYFKGLRLRPESQRSGLRLDQLGHAFIADLLRTKADIADEKRHLVRLCRVVAGDESVDRFELVDEAVLEQKIQRAVHGRRGRIAMQLTQLIEQVVSLDRFIGGSNQLQHFPAQGRQAKSPLLAGVLHRAYEITCIVRMRMVCVAIFSNVVIHGATSLRDGTPRLGAR